MKRIKSESLKALNQKLDIVRVLEEMGVADIADTHPEVLSSCPFHAGTSVEAVLTVDKKSRTAICDESQCVVASGEPLLEVYARAAKKTLDDSARYWAPVMDVTLDYDEIPEPTPPPPAEAEADSVKREAAAPADSGEVLHAGEIDADDLVALASEHAADAHASHAEAVVSVGEPVASGVREEVEPSVPAASPLDTTKFAVPEAVQPGGVRADRLRDEEAVVRYLLGDDPAAHLDVTAHGISDVDFRCGGPGPGGLSLHGTLVAVVRKLRERRQGVSEEAVLSLSPESHRSAVGRLLDQIVRGTTTDRKRFRQALRRLSDGILRENLESALRAGITDILTHPDEDAHTLLRQTQERLISVSRYHVGPLRTQEEAMADVLQAIFDREEVPIPTFSEGLNKILNGGLQYGQLAVLVGASGSGKTTFLLQMADGIAAANAARVQKGIGVVPVVIIATASSRRQLTVRSLSRLSKMNAGALLSKRWISGWEGDFLESEIDINEDKESVSTYYERRVREAEAAYRAAEPSLFIVEASPWTSIDAIRANVEQALRRVGSRSAVLFIDTLHHVGAGGPMEEPAWGDPARLEAVGARLKQLAVTMGLPVVASMEPPGAADLRHARAAYPLQAVADIVLHLSTDEDILAAGNVKQPPNTLSKRQLAFKELLDRLREDNPLEFSHSEFAVIEPLKHRTGALNPSVFIYNKAWHSFEELEP